MNTSEIHTQLDKLTYSLQNRDALTMKQYEILQRANRLRYTLLNNHVLTLKQRIEALFLLEGVLMKDINNLRRKPVVDRAIVKVYPNFEWLGYYTFAEIIGTTQSRVYKLAKCA